MLEAQNASPPPSLLRVAADPWMGAAPSACLERVQFFWMGAAPPVRLQRLREQQERMQAHPMWSRFGLLLVCTGAALRLWAGVWAVRCLGGGLAGVAWGWAWARVRACVLPDVRVCARDFERTPAAS